MTSERDFIDFDFDGADPDVARRHVGDSHCAAFRERLERALVGPPLPAELSVLSWHEHLLGCAPCRELLAREEALELLLASLPEPRLAPELSRRVVLRLRGVRADRLDALLELDAPERAPAGLAGRVLAGVRSERALDALLELDVVEVPPGLAARVLDSLAPAPPRVLRWRARHVLALAAGVGFALIAWWTVRDAREPALEPRGADVARSTVDAEEAELIAFLERRPDMFEMLENPLVWGSDSELELALGASLALGDEALLELEAR